MNFEYTHILWILPFCVLALGVAFILDEIARRGRMPAAGDSGQLLQMAKGHSKPKRIVRSLLWSGAMVASVIALCNPRKAAQTTFREHGMDIVFVSDFSISMLAEDVYPNRLARSLREAESLSEDLRADRLASVVFAGGAVHFPLTHDHKAAMSLTRGVSPADISPGADIGQAIKLAYCILKPIEAGKLCEVLRLGEGGQPLYGEIRPPARAERPSIDDRSSVMVIFSDGEDSEGYALREAQIARSLGIELFVVGVGSEEGALVPMMDEDGKLIEMAVSVRREVSRVNSELLRSLLGEESHRYHRLDGNGVRRGRLLEDLEGLKRGGLSEREIQSTTSLYDRFVALAFLLLVLESFLSDRKWRKEVSA